MIIPAWIMIIITDGGMEDGTVARCLPLLVGLSEDITHIKETLNVAMDKVARVEMEVVLKLEIFLKIVSKIFFYRQKYFFVFEFFTSNIFIYFN